MVTATALIADTEQAELDEFERIAAQRTVAKLSYNQQRILVEHANGPRHFNRDTEMQSINALRERGLITYDDHRKKTPRCTVPTEAGRTVIGEILGSWADLLALYGTFKVRLFP